MTYRGLEGVPAFSGNVTRIKVESHVIPTFDESFDVEVRKVQLEQGSLRRMTLPQLEDVPTISDEEPRVITVKPENPTFDKKLTPKIYKIKRG